MVDRSRRSLLLAAPAIACAAFDPLGARQALAAALAALPPDQDPQATARDETFWGSVGRAYTADRSVVNLNNGGVSPAPAVVQRAMARHLERHNSWPSAEALLGEKPETEAVRRQLAAVFGGDAEEIAITRNASEGLFACQLGLDLKPGDEVVATNQDYPRMLDAFRQRERRDGVVLKTFSIPVPCTDPGEIVRRYEAQITERTRLILVCHVINLTGQVLPVREIAALGRSRGIPVIVDGAHSLAHLDFRIPDLGGDCFASSLHKWLCAPHGTGLLYVRRDRIPDLWPLLPASHTRRDDIRKFEEVGTVPLANRYAIAEALAFHQELGAARKLARLRHLRDHWIERLASGGRMHLNTSPHADHSAGFANVRFDGLDTRKLQQWLWVHRRILTTPIVHDEFEGLRVSPGVYTSLDEIDRFCDAVEHALAHGLPA